MIVLDHVVGLNVFCHFIMLCIHWCDIQNKIEFNSGKILQSTEISPLNVIKQVILKAQNSDYVLQTDYSDYTIVNGVNFPQKIALLATNQKTKATCDFSILRIEFNTDLKFSPTITDRFSRGDIEQLLKK